MTARPALKIFVSSPGDVGQERVIMQRVLGRLAQRFDPVAEIAPVFWEHEPLLASDTFQSQIVPPSQTDIVVSVLWSRLGTRLPSHITRPDGTTYASGTEYEFEDAVNAYRERGIPELLVYRKTAAPLVSLRAEDLDERRAQERALQAFIDRWFHEDGTLIAAYHQFEDSGDFEELVEQHLRKLIERRLEGMGVTPAAAAAAARPSPTWTEGSPFRGLEAFELEHAPVFFGRTKAVSDALAALEGQAQGGRAFLLLIGASGSGKSSMARAGLLPMLIQPGVVEGVGLWRRATFRPSDASDVFRGLAAALSRDEALPELTADGTSTDELARTLREPLAASALMKGALSQAAAGLEGATRQPDARLVLLVDQMEELFTQPHVDEGTRSAFVHVLDALARSGRVWVVATLRSDFYHRCGELPALVALKEGSGQYDLLPPDASEIAQLIRMPAIAAGLRFEEDPRTGARLDDLLRDEALADPASLPLLQFTLEELHRSRTQEGVLTLEAFRGLGGLAGAIQTRADQVLESLDEEARAALPNLFRALVTVSAGQGQAAAGRQASLNALREPRGLHDLVDALTQARLLTAGAAEDGSPVVRITHEALLSKWTPLSNWIRDNRRLLSVRTRVKEAADRWVAVGESEDMLLPEGRLLAEGEELTEAFARELAPTEHRFVAASAAKAARAKRVRRVGVATLGVLTVLATGAALLANQMRGAAEEARAESRTRLINSHVSAGWRLAEVGDRAGALQWFVEALKEQAGGGADERVARVRIADALRFTTGLERVVPLTGRASIEYAVSPDGRLLATGSPLRLVDLGSGEVRWLGDVGESAGAPAFSRDGRHLVTVEWSTVRVWDVASGAVLTEVPSATDSSGAWDRPPGTEMPMGIGPPPVTQAALSPDGGRFVTAHTDGSAVIWDTSTGRAAAPAVLHGDDVLAVAFSPDGSRFATGSADGTAAIWDASSGAPVSGPLSHPGAVRSVSYSENGGELLTVSAGVARVWSRDGQARGPTLRHGNWVESAAMNAEGTRVATAGADGRILVWDPGTGRPLYPGVVFEPSVFGVLFTPDGEEVIGLATNRIVRAWQTEVGRPTRNPLLHVGPVVFGGLAEGGGVVTVETTLDTVQYVRVWSPPPPPRATSVLDGPVAAQIEHVSFSPDGSRLVTAGSGTWATLWDLTGSRPRATELPHPVDSAGVGLYYDEERSYHAEFSPDGGTLVTAGGEGSVLLWDVATLVPRAPPLRHEASVNYASFSPDGSRVVTASDDATARVWEAATGGAVTPPLEHEGLVEIATFSPDGTRVLTASADGTARVWDARTGDLLRTFQHEYSVWIARFGPDGTWVATGSFEATPLVWDVETGELHPRSPGELGLVVDVALGPDGRKIVSAGSDAVARVWDPLTGRPLGPEMGHGRESVTSARFSPDGVLIATASDDGLVRLWDATTSAPVVEPIWLGRSVALADFSPDGTRLAAAAGSTVFLFDIDRDQRPVEDLVILAQLLSGRRIDETGSQNALELGQVGELWAQLTTH